jgi:hypothetical protein
MSVFSGTHLELAKELGVGERQLYRQLKSGKFGIRKIKTGLYELDGDTETEKGTVVNFAEWRAKKMKEDALKSKREREILEGTLLSRDEVMKQLGVAFHTTKASLLTIPNTIAGIVAVETNANVVKEIIEGAIRETLVDLRSSLIRGGFDQDTDEASAEIDSVAMG